MSPLFNLTESQSVGTFLIFGDGEIDSIMIKTPDGWMYHRLGQKDMNAYSSSTVCAWLTNPNYFWSFS